MRPENITVEMEEQINSVGSGTQGGNMMEFDNLEKLTSREDDELPEDEEQR